MCDRSHYAWSDECPKRREAYEKAKENRSQGTRYKVTKPRSPLMRDRQEAEIGQNVGDGQNPEILGPTPSNGLFTPPDTETLSQDASRESRDATQNNNSTTDSEGTATTTATSPCPRKALPKPSPSKSVPIEEGALTEVQQAIQQAEKVTKALAY